MSKAKDRTRAELGWIFRDGKLVKKEDYYEAHPTPEMRAETQAQVDTAVRDILAQKETELATPQGKTYFCTKCLKYHRKPESVIYKAHVQYEDHNVPTI